MKFKTFESYSNLPPGTSEEDPSAPWNYKNDAKRYYRDNTSKSEDFTIIKTDYSEFALLKEKKTGHLYIAYLDHYAIPYAPWKEDIHGEHEEMPIDDLAIIYMASDAKQRGYGAEDWESLEKGPIVLIDEELCEILIKEFRNSKGSLKYRSIYNSIADILESSRDSISKIRGFAKGKKFGF
jgi:hypothetical protein